MEAMPIKLGRPAGKAFSVPDRCSEPIRLTLLAEHPPDRQVAERLDRVLAHVRTFLDRGDVALIAHGHSLRVAGARCIGLPAGGGVLLKLGTETLSTLGFEHDNQVIDTWNAA